MGKIPLSKDSEFVVGEDKILNYILAVLFFALFLYGFIDAGWRHFKNIDYQSYFFVLALLPAIYCFRRGQSKRLYIRVNKKGIYKEGQLITGWSNLLKVYIAQEEKKAFFSIQDNFILVVEYRKEGFKQAFRRKIPLTNTQNKSEEEVLEVVNFFWNEYKRNPGTEKQF